MKCKVWDDGKAGYFQDLHKLRIQAYGKTWIFDHCTEQQLRFKLAPMGGYAGNGNYLKQWRKRNGYTQADAATELGLSQSMLARIETGSRRMPEAVFERIYLDNQQHYGRS